MAKDLIIGAFSNYGFDAVKPWIQSINDTGFEGDKVLICINTSENTQQQIRDAGFQVVAQPKSSNMMFHMERFYHIYNFLKVARGKYRYVVTTDVRDVIFQVNPRYWLENLLRDYDCQLISSSESITIENEDWNKHNIITSFGQELYEEIKKYDILNVGTLAGRGEAVCDLCGMLFQLSMNRKDWVADQAAYNVLMRWYPYNDVTIPTTLGDDWACNLHVTNYFGAKNLKTFINQPLPYFEDGLVKSGKTNEPFAIVHQYDRDPEIKKFYEGNEYIIVDCPPAADSPITKSVLLVADLAIVPFIPDGLNMTAAVKIRDTIEDAKIMNPYLRGLLLLNRVEPNTKITMEVMKLLPEFNMPKANIKLHKRTHYAETFLMGATVHNLKSKAKEAIEEIEAFTDEVLEFLNSPQAEEA